MTQRFEVIIAPEAARDIEDIYHYIAEHDGLVTAARVLAGIESACAKLAEFPNRGNVPKELDRMGIAEYREAHFKPYRIIYRVANRIVEVYCVLDRRRDMQTLLQRRLLR